jgi:putative ABC transport system ATP-binding protein
MTVLIEATGLQKGFAEGDHRFEVLRGVDLDLWTGEMTALAGPSGSGKSVLLDLLAGWSVPDAGQVRWGEALSTPGWAHLAFVPQALGLLPDLTAWHNVVLPLRLERGAAGLRDETPRVRGLLERLGLDHLRDRSPGELSFGEQQRVAVARAVVLDPQLVLADEPTSHQDERSADAVVEVLREVCSRGGGVLLASHDDDILARSDRVVRLVDGVVEEAAVETP